MIKSISIILCLTFGYSISYPLFAQEKYKESEIEEKSEKKDKGYYDGVLSGRLSAEDNYSSGGWFAGGIASGVLLGLIGTGIISGISQIGNPEPPSYEIMRVQSYSTEYRAGFISGYGKKARSKKLSSSAVGGLVGTAAFLIIYLSAQSD